MMPFQLVPPAQATSCVVFASPHSARIYPSDLLQASMLDLRALRSSEDAYVDLLLRAAPDHGAPLLLAGAPRAYVDYNRAASELDPALIDGVARVPLNPRVAAGLGVIPRVVARGRAIYRGKLTAAEAQRRIDGFWHPYHNTLDALLRTQRARFGQTLLLDMHSMPHEALRANTTRFRSRPDVVLGDRFGASAAPWVMEAVEAALGDAGLRTARNAPFAGAHVVKTYGRPSLDMHAVQVEIDRALYLDESRVEPSPDFAGFQTVMDGVVGALAAIGAGGADRLELAAE